MMKHVGVAFALVLFAICPDAVNAQAGEGEAWSLPGFGETDFSLTSTTLTQYRLDNFDDNQYNDDFFSLTERVDLALEGEDLTLSARLDGFLPVFGEGPTGEGPSVGNRCPPGEEFRCDIEWDLRPERVALRWRPEDWDIIFGDSYAVFGRGIALSLRKVASVGIDTTVRGLQVRYESGRFFAQALGGYANSQNLDPVNLAIIPEHPDFLYGARVGARLGEYEDLEFGMHGVRMTSLAGCEDSSVCGFFFAPIPDLVSDVTATTLGWTFSAPALLDGEMSLYAEANMMLREDDPLNESQEGERYWGRAIYTSAQFMRGGLSALLELKDYHDFLQARSNGMRAFHVYSSSPTTDLETEQLRGIANSRGGALRLTYAFSPGPWSAGVGGIMHAHEDEDRRADPFEGILAQHVYAEVSRENHAAMGDFGWAFEMSAGYRRETYLHDPAGDFVDEGDVEAEIYHGSAEVVLSQGNHSVDISVQNREESHAGFIAYQRYRRGGVALTYSWQSEFSISPALRWSTERPTQPVYYPSLEMKWVFDHGSHLRLFGGRNPGGRVCSGGVCRDVPPFQGVQAELVYRL